MGITESLIDLASAEVPQAASEMMRLSLFDWAACGCAGAQEPDYRGFVALHEAMGGAPEASLIGGGQSSAPMAALINGTLSHALDYDDTHFGHIGHPSVAVIPAVLALAERQGLGFADVLRAATIGVEASIQTGLWLGRGHYQVGYHQTATAGAFGAALGASAVLGLKSDQTRTALGICASLASGLKSQFGTMSKPLNAGLAARSGVEAALWAKAGMTAAHDGLAGPLGFGLTHHGVADESQLAQIGQGAWQIETVSHKFHACCHGLHAMLEALAGADAQKDLSKIAIRTHPRWMTVCNIKDPETGLAAKFSYRQTAAMALMGHDTAAISSYTDAITQDTDIQTIRNAIEVIEDDRLSETQAEVLLSFTDGTTQALRHDLMDPMPLNTRTAKLQSKAVALLGHHRAEALWTATAQNDLPAVMAQLVTS